MASRFNSFRSFTTYVRKVCSSNEETMNGQEPFPCLVDNTKLLGFAVLELHMENNQTRLQDLVSTCMRASHCRHRLNDAMTLVTRSNRMMPLIFA